MATLLTEKVTVVVLSGIPLRLTEHAPLLFVVHKLAPPELQLPVTLAPEATFSPPSWTTIDTFAVQLLLLTELVLSRSPRWSAGNEAGVAVGVRVRVGVRVTVGV